MYMYMCLEYVCMYVCMYMYAITCLCTLACPLSMPSALRFSVPCQGSPGLPNHAYTCCFLCEWHTINSC